MAWRVDVDLSSLRGAGREAQQRVRRKLAQVLKMTGDNVVRYLRSYLEERTKNGRRRHPGRWADRTGVLADSYRAQVDQEKLELTIENVAWYAHIVEAKSGYFVVRGVADPDGPVVAEFRRAVHELAPEWEVR